MLVREADMEMAFRSVDAALECDVTKWPPTHMRWPPFYVRTSSYVGYSTLNFRLNGGLRFSR